MKKQIEMPGAAYMRYSSHNQNEQSIEGQRRIIEAYAKQHGIKIIEEYIDRAIPGKSDNRPEFQRLVADCETGKFKALVVYKTDRFSRNKADSAIYKRHIRAFGIQIHYAAETIPLGPEGVLMESIMEGLAEYYSVELSQKVKRGMHESALKCQYIGGGRLFGYSIKDKKFVVNPREAPIVQRMFDMFNNGIANVEICKYVNALGFRTSRNLPFSKNSISRMIKNEKYIGTYSIGEVYIEDAIPAIINKDVFFVAQNELKKRQTSKQVSETKAKYLLSGKLYCGHCKKKMIGISGTGKGGGKFYYYYCPDQRTKKGCDLKQVSRNWLENLVVEETLRYVLQPGAIKYIAKKCCEIQLAEHATDKSIETLKQKIIDNKGAIANILAAIETGVGTASLPERIKALESERVQLEKELRRAEEHNPVLSEKQLEYMLRQYAEPGADVEAFKEDIIKRFITQVYLYNDKLLIYYTIRERYSEVPIETIESLETKGPEVFDQCNLCSTTSKPPRIQ